MPSEKVPLLLEGPQARLFVRVLPGVLQGCVCACVAGVFSYAFLPLPPPTPLSLFYTPAWQTPSKDLRSVLALRSKEPGRDDRDPCWSPAMTAIAAKGSGPRREAAVHLLRPTTASFGSVSLSLLLLRISHIHISDAHITTRKNINVKTCTKKKIKTKESKKEREREIGRERKRNEHICLHYS